MTGVLHFSSPPSAENSSSYTTCDDDDEGALSFAPQTSLSFAHGNGDGDGFVDVTGGDPRVEEEGKLKKRRKQEGDQLSVLVLLVTFFRKSWTSCTGRELCVMDIGMPTNVRHVSHVTFDRFHGFLGSPVEFEPEVPTRVPSARFILFPFIKPLLLLLVLVTIYLAVQMCLEFRQNQCSYHMTQEGIVCQQYSC